MLSRGKTDRRKNKKENDKNIRDMKMWILGFDRDYLQYDCHSLNKNYFWYLKEVITMLKGFSDIASGHASGLVNVNNS